MMTHPSLPDGPSHATQERAAFVRGLCVKAENRCASAATAAERCNLDLCEAYLKTALAEIGAALEGLKP